MPFEYNGVKAMEKARRKLTFALGCGADLLAELYAFDVSQTRGNIPPWVPPHSSTGEYPHIEYGQGAQNIGSGVSLDLVEARAGIKGEDTGTGPIGPYHKVKGGMHLHYLTQRGRLGIVDTFNTNRSEIMQEIVDCADAAR